MEDDNDDDLDERDAMPRTSAQCRTMEEHREFFEKARAITKAQLQQQLARRRAQAAAEPSKPPKKPKPRKKKTMSTKAFDALAASLGKAEVELPERRLTKKRAKKAKSKKAKAFAASLQAEPKVRAYAADAWGIVGLADNQSAVAGQEEAESLSRVAFTLTGERSVPDMVRARDRAKAKALGVTP